LSIAQNQTKPQIFKVQGHCFYQIGLTLVILFSLFRYHPDRTVFDANSADEHQQRAQAKAFHDEFYHKHSPFTFMVLFCYAITYKDCPA
jgi:hypothetical protein